MASNFQAARALGWASLAIGLTEIAATDWLEDYLGLDEHHAFIRACGVREIATGATILSQPGFTATVAAGLWARVVGDAMDLSTLGAAAGETRRPKNLAIFTGLILGITGLDLLVALRSQQNMHRAKNISKAARRRVVPTQALASGRGLTQQSPNQPVTSNI